MGLKQIRFIDWFKKKFPEAVQVVPRRLGARFDSVFIDVNCILHPAMMGAKDEATFVKKLFAILHELLFQFIPTRICYLAVDGPAPLAKIVTQKSRRAAKGSKPSTGMSSLQITPGCPFMTRIEHYLSYFAVRYMQQNVRRDGPPILKFVIDHSNNPGEGETKIIQNILQQASLIRGRPCAIISMDSDVVLQAIALDMPNVYAVRRSAPHEPALFISIDRFMHTLEGLFPGESDRVRLDFCALCLFRGNDYLRGLAVGIDRLWLAYLYTKLVDPVIQQRGPLKFLIDAEFKTFDLVFLKQLLLNSYKRPIDLALPADLTSKLPKQEDDSTSYPLGDDEYEVDDLEEDMKNLDTQDGAANETDEEEEEEEEEEKEEEEVGSDSLHSVNKFLAGVLWNLEMYCSGKCSDITFRYNYSSSPPRRALIKFVDTTAQTKRYQGLLPSATSKIISVKRSDTPYLHPLVCGLILLPVERGGEYLPQSIAPLHAEFLPSDSKTLTFEEMEAIDAKVRMLIDILGSSEKGNDREISRELSTLYETRPPYIWARHTAGSPGPRPTPLPASPSAILAQLGTSTVLGKASTVSPERFPDLKPELDIRCNATKAPPPRQTNGNHPSNTEPDTVPWAQALRQKNLTWLRGEPSPRWPLITVRVKASHPTQQPLAPSQKQKPPQKQQKQKQKQNPSQKQKASQQHSQPQQQ
ncbi:hypothetical protein BGX34_005273 [Mortierella sp. NVP85]|nr:hypothetical protein BGX34_005273 [Mortierella sp. NVP85]